MSSSSTVYTIGTALNRAFENQVAVAVLVNGEWLEGEIVALDGYGIVLDREGTDHYVVKLDSICVVHVKSAAPMTSSAESKQSETAKPRAHGSSVRSGPRHEIPMSA